MKKTKEELQEQVDQLFAEQRKLRQALELSMTGRLVFLGVVADDSSTAAGNLWHYYMVPDSETFLCVGYGKQGPFYGGLTQSPATSDEPWADRIRTRARELNGGFHLHLDKK